MPDRLRFEEALDVAEPLPRRLVQRARPLAVVRPDALHVAGALALGGGPKLGVVAPQVERDDLAVLREMRSKLLRVAREHVDDAPRQAAGREALAPDDGGAGVHFPRDHDARVASGDDR